MKNREALIRVTATSILHSACRDIATFTARSIHGILSLPSISFRKPKAENPAPDRNRFAGRHCEPVHDHHR